MAGLWKHFNDGGWGMYPLVAWLLLAIMIIIERWVSLFLLASSDVDGLLTSLKTCLFRGDLRAAVRVCVTSNAPAARILIPGLASTHLPAFRIQLAIDSASLHLTPRLSSRTPYLPVIGNLGIWTGLLGTLTGLVRSPSCWGESVDPSQKARILAEGISEAMNCTALGLVIAIVSAAGYAVLRSRENRLLDDIHRVSLEVLNLVVTNREKFDLLPRLSQPCETMATEPESSSDRVADGSKEHGKGSGGLA